MKISNPKDMIGKLVTDFNGVTIGVVDKIWKSWNEEYPGWFLGVRLNEEVRNTWFRGTTKLIPIYNDYIQDIAEHIMLNKTAEQLSRYLNKTVSCSDAAHPIDHLMDMPIYDRNHSRVGTFYGWVESDGIYKHYGCFVDPYLCDIWDIPYNIVMPLQPSMVHQVFDTITLNRTLEELREYWRQYSEKH
ncbi:MAG: hypothetical protein DRN12_05855 [Thermoplasmata archaeon]|nr:MAG: hypothetical protein DRN12_05855 [Thermoplasmata archaeon]